MCDDTANNVLCVPMLLPPQPPTRRCCGSAVGAAVVIMLLPPPPLLLMPLTTSSTTPVQLLPAPAPWYHHCQRHCSIYYRCCCCTGTKSLREILTPAIELAEQGFPVSPCTSFEWCKGAALIKEQGGDGQMALVDENGQGPKPGQLWRNPDLANTYKRIAEHGAAKGKDKKSVGAG